MNLNDLNGVSLATAHGLARDAYNRASSLFHGYYGDPLAVIDEAVQAHPDFLMGHALKAGLILSTTDARLYPLAAQTLDVAERYQGTGDERARGHLAAARAWHAGDWNQSEHLYGKVLRLYPRDVLALQMAHLADFLMGRSMSLRDRPAATLKTMTSSDPGYGFVNGMHAFGLEETGDYAAAEQAGQHALQHNRRDPWAIHAVAHVHEMCGNLSDGIRWLEQRREDWIPDNAFSFHNAWHLALYWLELDEYDSVLSIYDELIRPNDSDVVLELIDASAMLWRLHLRNVDVGDRWQSLVAQWRSRVDDRLYVFNDIHALMALLACGESTAARTLVASIESDVRGCGQQAELAQAAASLVARGLFDFAEERYSEALPILVRGHEISFNFGGSNAQRDVIALTILRCAELAGAEAVSATLLMNRLERRPDSPFTWSALADWRTRMADHSAATEARTRADSARGTWLRALEQPRLQVA